MSNKPYDYSFLPSADDDLDKIYDYIAITLNNIKAANDTITKIEKKIEIVCAFPQSGITYKKRKDFKLIFINKYIVFYKIDKKKKLIKIYRVLYGPSDIENKELE
jgi:addiction module RelE/StbE family toxin